MVVVLKTKTGFRHRHTRRFSFNLAYHPGLGLRGEARCTTRVLGLGSLASDWLLALPLQRPHIRLSTAQRNAYSIYAL
jgi:hypothetical protein